MAANELFFEKYPEGQLPHQIQIRPFNAEKTKNLRHLSPEGKNLKIILNQVLIFSKIEFPKIPCNKSGLFVKLHFK